VLHEYDKRIYSKIYILTFDVDAKTSNETFSLVNAVKTVLSHSEKQLVPFLVRALPIRRMNYATDVMQVQHATSLGAQRGKDWIR
jgi:hypothetical protein